MATTKKKSSVKSWLPSVGDKVIIRTVTHYYTGKITKIDNRWIALNDAAWVADTQRWATCLSTGSLGEVEPYPGPCVVATGAIVDVSPWNHALPRVIK